jgi:crotonobetainyl-CoA:carnitine CoA-transferase CaiB-like acyl-CoA transferase
VSEAGGSDHGRPLDGIRVLSLEQQQALPYATQLMARLGAEVVRVEHPGRGETGRDTQPSMKDPFGRSTGATFLRNNLGKRSIAIDLKAPAGRDLVLRLAPRFDVVAENFRAGTLARLGLGYGDVAKVHPKVVYASITGFGADGSSPYSAWSAFAPVVEAMSGFYDQKRRPDQPPPVGVAGGLGDTSSGLFAVIGILAALRHRDRKGIGQQVDIAMYDAMVAMTDVPMNFMSLGKTDLLTPPSIVAPFRASDGWFVMMCSRRAQFELLATMIGRPDWLTDPRLPGPVAWGAHVEDIIRPALESWAADKTRREVCDILNGAGIAVGPCHSVNEVIADPHVRARNMVVEMARPDGVDTPVLTPGNPVKLSKSAGRPESRVPWIGEHTDEVLAEELGLNEAALAALRAAKAIA